jgi:hypothetical protein
MLTTKIDTKGIGLHRRLCVIGYIQPGWILPLGSRTSAPVPDRIYPTQGGHI